MLRFKVDVIIKNNEIRKKIVDYLQQEPEFIVEGFVGKDYTLVTNKPSVIILGDDVTGNGYQYVIDLINVKITPILLVTNISQKTSSKDLLILDIPIVDSIDFEEIKFTNLIQSFLVYRLKVLCKLDLTKFHKTVTMAIEKIQNYNIEDYEQTENIELITSQERSEPSNWGYSKKNANCMVVIGSSAGGPQLVREIVSKLPPNFPPVIVVQHMNAKFSHHFAERLAKAKNSMVKLARTGDIISPGMVFVAPGGKHLEISKSGSSYKINVTDDPPVNFVRPSVDVTLFSAIRAFDGKVVSVILSGMGADGREGSRAVKKFGGIVIALRKEDTPVYGMNRAVIESKIPDKIVSIGTMVPTIKNAIDQLQ